ncbi:MAG: ABC transporter substrate-binding protein [Chloroflexota bacterium]
MRRFITAALALTLFLAACAEGQTPGPTSLPTPPTPVSVIESVEGPIQPAHAAELRFALIGQPQQSLNVWALFDEPGATYIDRALMNDYWPRLYTLAPPDFVFTPRAANGLPLPVTQEGEFYTALVKLRPDLKWTDGTPFTAEDVAFTVNTALLFELGFDWRAYYPLAYLARTEAIDATTIKFYFKQMPDVSVWQYGVLQGPVIQKDYWRSKIDAAATLLPDDVLRQDVEDTRVRIAGLEVAVDSFTYQLAVLKSQGRGNRQLEKSLTTSQSALEEANTDLAIFMEVFGARIRAAQRALYAMDDAEEPTLGVWMPLVQASDKWVNLANPDLPFGQPNYDSVVYTFFGSEQDALNAFELGWVDAILTPNGLTVLPEGMAPGARVNLNGRARFLVFNPFHPELADPTFRAALSCTIRSSSRNGTIQLDGFVLPGNALWLNTAALTPCAGIGDSILQMDRAVDLLGSAGYSWEVEPTPDQLGQGLHLPNGQAFPALILLSPSEEFDPLQAREAARIEDAARRLGISLTVEYVSPQDLRYAVFSAQNYDMAIMGWRLSLYPGYLCEWFGWQSPFVYDGTSPVLSGAEGLKSECDALRIDSDLDAARNHIFNLQYILAEDLPFIPLYAETYQEVYGSISYPFGDVLGGLGSLYGAPSFAIPSP